MVPFFFLQNPHYFLGMTKEEYNKYQKTDRYLDEPLKIPPVLLYFAFNYRYNNYWWY